jgi:hypothetical protein
MIENRIDLSDGNIILVELLDDNKSVVVSEDFNAGYFVMNYEELRTLIDALETLKGNMES